MTVGEVPIAHPQRVDNLTVPVDSRVFEQVPSADFYVGRVALPGAVIMENEDLAHGQFRANVYIDELEWLPRDSRGDDGTERDLDDDHSMRFSVLAKRNEYELPRVVGVSRLVVKESVEQPLPVERYFPEAFSEELPEGVVEASRFIARHPNARTQRAIALANIRAMVMHAAEVEAPNIYAVVEEPLARYFDMLHIPFDRLSGLKVLPGYGATENMAIRFDPLEIIRTAEKPDLSESLLAKMFSSEARADNGLGYYDLTMTKKVS